jgi:hypothetical protein
MALPRSKSNIATTTTTTSINDDLEKYWSALFYTDYLVKKM